MPLQKMEKILPEEKPISAKEAQKREKSYPEDTPELKEEQIKGIKPQGKPWTL